MSDLNVEAIDFFCGAGGLTRGLLDAGIRVRAGIDIDLTARKTYEHNNYCNGIPVAFLLEDVRELDAGKIASLISPGAITVFAGCPPCQPFSRMRTDKTKSVKDLDLLLEFGRLVEQFSPDFVFVENVRGMREHSEIFLAFIRQLNSAGYKVAYKVVNAADYGVPQRRQRLVLLAAKGVVPTFPKATHNRKTWVTVRRAIHDPDLYPPIEAGEEHPNVPNHKASRLSEIMIKRLKKTPKDGGSRSAWDDDPELALRCHRNHNGHKDVYGRMAWDKVAPTLTTRFTGVSNGRFAHPEQLRGISLREGATLQGFPYRYEFFGVTKHISRHIGNAVPPPLARAFGEKILELSRYLPFKRVAHQSLVTEGVGK